MIEAIFPNSGVLGSLGYTMLLLYTVYNSSALDHQEHILYTRVYGIWYTICRLQYIVDSIWYII